MATKQEDAAGVVTQRAPSYEERLRIAKLASNKSNTKIKAFVPRCMADFDDGGAFPEIPVAQYPRQMGNPHNKSLTSSQTAGSVSVNSHLLTVQTDADGKVSYDGVVTGGTNADKKVYTKHSDIVPLAKNGDLPSGESIALPSEEETNSTKDRTQAALQALISSQIESAKPTGSAILQADTSKNMEEKTQFISYQADPDAPGYNPQCATRVIQVVQAQIDPMMPPKFKHKKVPRGPAEDPVPVLHTKPAKLTKEERDAWKVPACISNWKNTRGYTIPLDKRLAADGRNLIEHSINPNFANLAESLYVAERQAREEVSMRAKVRSKLAEQEAQKREEELRKLAMQARMDRGGVSSPVNHVHKVDGLDSEGQESPDNYKIRASEAHDSSTKPVVINSSEDDIAFQQRERLRMERKRQHERELRLESNKRPTTRLEDERDVSEKIALGQHTGTGGGGVDGRLYNQESGMDSGFGADDEYNAYSKPLFDNVATSIYKPSNSGGEGGKARGPVQFEKGK